MGLTFLRRGEAMTIKEFYEWAVKNHVEDYTIVIQNGTNYFGEDIEIKEFRLLIDEYEKEVVL